MKNVERQPRRRIDFRTVLRIGLVALGVASPHVGSNAAYAQGVPQEVLYPGIQPRRIGTTADGHPIYEQVSTEALRALRDAQRQPLYPNPEETTAKRPECESTLWQTTSNVMSPVMEREYREKQAQIVLARQAIGQRAEVPGTPPHERVHHWKGALFPLTTEPTPLRLELWTKDAAFNNLRTDRWAFYLADFRAYLKGTVALPTISNPDQVIFRIRWATGEVVLTGNVPTLQDILKYGGKGLLPVIDMTDPDVRAQVASLELKPRGLQLQGKPVCVPPTNVQR